MKVSTPRAQIKAKALVTPRLPLLTIGGKKIHQVGMPWHWGYEGLITGDVVNELTSLVGDPDGASGSKRRRSSSWSAASSSAW